MTRKEERRKAAFENNLGTISREMFELGAEWADDTMIERVCEWIYTQLNTGKIECGDIIGLIDDFKREMEE